MKFRLTYVYLLIAGAVIVFLAISTQRSTNIETQTAGKINNQQVPQDEIHKGMSLPGKEQPGKDNVSEGVRHEMEVLKEAVQKTPGDTLKLRQYADLLLAAHQPLKALQYYEKLSAIDPVRSDVHFSITYIYYNQGNFDKAEEETNKILDYHKDNPQALYNLGAISASKGNKEKARHLWEKILSKHRGTEVGELAAASLKKLQ